MSWMVGVLIGAIGSHRRPRYAERNGMRSRPRDDLHHPARAAVHPLIAALSPRSGAIMSTVSAQLLVTSSSLTRFLPSVPAQAGG